MTSRNFPSSVEQVVLFQAIMFRAICWLRAVVFFVLMGVPLHAAQYHLTNGDVVGGTPISYTDEGVAFRLDIGGLSPHIRWAKFTQESLKELVKHPDGARFGEVFLDEPADETPVAAARQITPNPVENRVPHYSKVGFVEAWTTPGALVLLLVLYAANLFAAFEIALFRQRSSAVVCGVSALLPGIGPLLFLSLPSAERHVEEAAPEAPEAPMALPQGTRPPEMPSGASGLGIAKAAHAAAGGGVEPSVYKRGDFTFNRRFVETKFASFFSMISKDNAALVVRTNKDEYVAKRVSRISMNEMHVQLLRGGTEQMIPFADILEFQIRAADAKA